jgi:hypothetical protein
VCTQAGVNKMQTIEDAFDCNDSTTVIHSGVLVAANVRRSMPTWVLCNAIEAVYEKGVLTEYWTVKVSIANSKQHCDIALLSLCFVPHYWC